MKNNSICLISEMLKSLHEIALLPVVVRSFLKREVENARQNLVGAEITLS